MGLRFEWDTRKALINVTKHGVSFEEARTIFGDPLSLTVADREHDEAEFRFAIVGRTIAGRLVVVSHVEKGRHYPHHQCPTRRPARKEGV